MVVSVILYLSIFGYLRSWSMKYSIEVVPYGNGNDEEETKTDGNRVKTTKSKSVKKNAAPTVAGRCRGSKALARQTYCWMVGLALPSATLNKDFDIQLGDSREELRRRRKEIFLKGLMGRVAFILEIGIA
ncbi:hypothetical protein M9H77_11719 [Catharanthus roseus]|uniref:Uncharacterized protein n=1 Tax=Catharanthus roseus TaxID=4058 RepID=A0ACC0BFF5_CATRO|nr:hypothetical protein M9H77_11719 [Catharanthus roseus]